MHAEENRIIVQRYIPACFFCGSGEGLKTFHSVPVCAACRAELRQKHAE